jgi:hypothetical protein
MIKFWTISSGAIKGNQYIKIMTKKSWPICVIEENAYDNYDKNQNNFYRLCNQREDPSWYILRSPKILKLPIQVYIICCTDELQQLQI